MKVISLRAAVSAVILVAAVCTAARVTPAEPAHARRGLAHGPERGAASSKADYCTDCHGPSGQGYHGYLTMPRLAGQTPEYIVNQLRNFAERSRERDLFINMSRIHGLGADQRAALAEHFHGLNPSPIGGGPQNLVGEGRRIYQEGIPEANIPACAACHGPDGKGQDAIPRLAGQLYTYTVKELTNWGRERAQGREDSSAVMAPIARALSPAQSSAIAAYVNSLR